MRFLIIIILFSSCVLLGDDLSKALMLFKDGKLSECDAILNKILSDQRHEKLSKDEQLKAMAMREYIRGNSQEYIELTLKNAEKIVKHNAWVNSDIIAHASTLSRTAADWKARGIAEYEQIAKCAVELLTRASDNGDPALAIKLAILKVKNYSLQGEYEKSIQGLRKKISFYYPTVLSRRNTKNIPEGARQLLVILGEQYTLSGIKTRSKISKVSDFSMAASCYTKALVGLKNKNTEFNDLVYRLLYLQERLRLLGYKLKLPSGITLKKEIQLDIVDEMLKQKRYHDVIMVLEKQRKPQFKMRYALALSEIGKIPEALAIIKEHKPQKQESAILLKIAKNAQAKNMNDEALEIYGIFIDNLPKAENISIIYFSMANIHLAKNNLTNAAENYKLAADKTNDEQVKSMALTTAANCFYNAGKFDTANAILQKLPPTPDKLLLEAQSALMSEKYLSALNKLETFLTYKNTNKQKREKALMLAITCSQKLRDNPKYEKFLKTYINCFSSSSNSSECILRMIELYRKESKDKALFELCETILLKRPDSTDNAVLVAKAASFIRNKNLREKAFLKLLDVNKIEAKGLLGICRENIPAKLKIRLLAKHNIEFSEEPEICEVYYQRAKLEYESRCYEKALKTVSILLNAKKIYIFEAIKMLQGKIYSALEQHEKARKSYSELLLAKPGTVASLEVSYLLSQSWEKSGNAEKAIATAWTGVPLNGKTTEKTKSIVKKLLQLIIRNAKEINSQEDLKDAKELLTAF